MIVEHMYPHVVTVVEEKLHVSYILEQKSSTKHGVDTRFLIITMSWWARYVLMYILSYLCKVHNFSLLFLVEVVDICKDRYDYFLS